MKIDAHQHFWRYTAAEHPWIPQGSALQRDWLPEDLGRIHRSLGFDGSIVVEARQSLAESWWLLGLADADPSVKGVVGWVDLQSDRVEDSLASLAEHPRFVGVRHLAQDEPDARFLVRPSVVRGIGALRQFGLTYDLVIYPSQLPAAIELVQRCPEQAFVLDHIAKPRIREGVIEPWASLIQELALHPNVCCKVSGLVTEADHQNWDVADFRPYLDVVFEAFQPERLMFGSDWPVCLLAAGYEQVEGLARAYVRHLEPEQAKGFWGSNCARFYLGSDRSR